MLNATNPTKYNIRRRENKAGRIMEKATHDAMLKFTVLNIIVDQQCCPTWKYFNENNMIFIPETLDTFIKSKK